MKIIFPWKKRQAERDAFFFEFSEAGASLKIDPQQIRLLQRKCNDGSPGWKNEIFSTLNGVAKGISISAQGENRPELLTIEKLLTQLSKVPAKDFVMREWLLIFVTTIGVFTFTTSILFASRRFMILTFIALCASAGMLGVSYGYKYRENYRNDATNSEKRDSMVVGGLFGVLLCIGVALFACTAQSITFSYTQWLAEKDREIALSNPELFPFMKKYLKENYDLNLVLADKKQTWLNTYLGIENLMGSPASINPTGDYCELYYSPRSLDHWGSIDSDSLNEVFHRVVLAHEAAHCIGIATDYKNMSKSNPESFPINSSIFPDERAKVTGIDSFIEAHEFKNTKRWREVVSDLFAIGFAKMHHPDQANDIIKEVVRIRSNAKHDFIHNSVCWVNYARDKAPPSLDSELYAWAVAMSVEPKHCNISRKNSD